MVNESPDPPEEEWELQHHEPWVENYDRPRGILTDIDRQFLYGFKEYESKVTTSERRRTIRERVKHSVFDLFYLPMLEDTQRERVFQELGDDNENLDLRTAVANFIEFLYLGVDGDIEWLEETIAHGIHDAEEKLRDDEASFYSGASVDSGVDVDIEITRGYDVDEIEERLRSGHDHSLTPAEIGVLVRTGRIDEEDVWELSNGEGGTPPEGEGIPINPTMPDRTWFSEDEDVEDLFNDSNTTEE